MKTVNRKKITLLELNLVTILNAIFYIIGIYVIGTIISAAFMPISKEILMASQCINNPGLFSGKIDSWIKYTIIESCIFSGVSILLMMYMIRRRFKKVYLTKENIKKYKMVVLFVIIAIFSIFAIKNYLSIADYIFEIEQNFLPFFKGVANETTLMNKYNDLKNLYPISSLIYIIGCVISIIISLKKITKKNNIIRTQNNEGA